MDSVNTHARSRLGALCRSAPASTGTDRATITAVTRQLYRAVVNHSDAVAGRIEDEQTTLGEGPGIDAYRYGNPVFAADLADQSVMRRWPVFAGHAVALGVCAAFAFPLRIGAINLGVLSLYSGRPEVLHDDHVSRALRLSTAVSYAMLGLFTDPAVDGVGPTNGAGDAAALSAVDGASLDADDAALHRPEVHQASGMLMIQLGIPIEEALARLRAYSFTKGQPLWEVARAVVAGRLRLNDDQIEDGR